MDLSTWLWTYDHRWFFNTKIPFLDKIWLLPMAVDLGLGGLTVKTLFFEEEKCLTQYGYGDWLLTQLSFQLLSIILIFFLFLRFRNIDKEHGRLFEHVEKTKAFNPRSYKYWIRTKGLLSILGFGVLSLGFIKFVWTWVGYILYDQHSFDVCESSFKRAFLANCITPLACLAPIALTLFLFFAIKIINILFSFMFPSLFVKIAKRL